MQIEPKQAQQWFGVARQGETLEILDHGRVVARVSIGKQIEQTVKPKRQAGLLAKKGRTLCG